MKSSNQNYLIVTIKSWNIERAHQFAKANPELKVKLVTEKDKLTYEVVRKFNPRYIFFPHWSWIIPRDIYENFEAVVFHMTDLPFGRGGSPLQNLITRGITQTRISALRVVRYLDAGPIYLKRDLSLEGSAKEIFEQVSDIIFDEMIPYIIRNEPVPAPQKGRVVVFKRRTAKHGNIANLPTLSKVYDYIRMLDAEGYPPAFVETSGLKMEFSDAKLKKDFILATVKIRMKK